MSVHSTSRLVAVNLCSYSSTDAL